MNELEMLKRMVRIKKTFSIFEMFNEMNKILNTEEKLLSFIIHINIWILNKLTY